LESYSCEVEDVVDKLPDVPPFDRSSSCGSGGLQLLPLGPACQRKNSIIFVLEKGLEPILQQVFKVRLGLLGLWVIGPQLQEPPLGAISAIALLSRSDELAVRVIKALNNL